MMKSVKSHYATGAAFVAAVALLLSQSVTVFAVEEAASASPPPVATASDGRPLYTEDTRPDFPVFNSLIGEENFLSITGPDGTVTLAGDGSLELQLDQQYDVTINYDNNGLPRGITTRAIANDTKVQIDFPSAIASERTLTATISARNSQPESVSSTLTLTAAEPMALEVVQGSARIVNDNPTNNQPLSTKDLFGDGETIGTNSMIGIVLYGSENAGSVVFSFRTVPMTEQASEIASQATTDDQSITGATISAPTTSPTPTERHQPDALGIIGIIGASLLLVAIIVYSITLCHKK